MEKVIVSKNSSEKEGVEKRKDLKMKDKVIKMFNVSLRGKKKSTKRNSDLRHLPISVVLAG